MFLFCEPARKKSVRKKGEVEWSWAWNWRIGTDTSAFEGKETSGKSKSALMTIKVTHKVNKKERNFGM